MGYCTQNGDTPGDIAPTLISIEQLTQLTCDETVDPAVIVQQPIDDAIADADSTVDSYAGRIYAVPFNPVPAKVKQLSRVISTYNLFARRQQVFAGKLPEAIGKMYDDAIAFLKDVSKGVAVIDGAVKPAVNTTRTGGSFHSHKRKFDQHHMDKL
jgi:phage gp36-like protein